MVFPVPDLREGQTGDLTGGLTNGPGGRGSRGGGEGERRGLLSGHETRPQMGWGRLVAGEAFELGTDDDDDED